MKLNKLTKIARILNNIVTNGATLSLSFRANEMQSEAGELGNVVKKLERIKLNIPGNKPEDSRIALETKLRHEFGDVLLTIGLLAEALEVDLEVALGMKLKELEDRYRQLNLLTRVPHSAGKLKQVIASLT
jgi:NTP pyrophosphatase (non-canonical NTP hydrolase)